LWGSTRNLFALRGGCQASAGNDGSTLLEARRRTSVLPHPDEKTLRPPERFAESAGLTHYSWLSFESVDQGYDDDAEYAERGVVRVD
jgi:hypothetical protein